LVFKKLKTPGKKNKKTALWFILTDIALVFIILGICALLLKHTPSEYNPPSFIKTQSQQICPYLTSEILAKFYNGIKRNEPFTMEISQDGVNESIISLGWPQMYQGIIFSTPVIKFEKNACMAMGRVNYNGVDTVLTVEMQPIFDTEGKLTLQLSKVKTGALNITYFAKKAAQKVYNDQFAGISPDPEDLVACIVGSILADKAFLPAFKADKHKFKVDKIQLESKKVSVRFVPFS
jgi:hypothetical protein